MSREAFIQFPYLLLRHADVNARESANATSSADSMPIASDASSPDSPFQRFASDRIAAPQRASTSDPSALLADAMRLTAQFSTLRRLYASLEQLVALDRAESILSQRVGGGSATDSSASSQRTSPTHSFRSLRHGFYDHSHVNDPTYDDHYSASERRLRELFSRRMRTNGTD